MSFVASLLEGMTRFCPSHVSLSLVLLAVVFHLACQPTVSLQMCDLTTVYLFQSRSIHNIFHNIFHDSAPRADDFDLSETTLSPRGVASDHIA